ncbi:MAG: ATP-binding cassette domain-containing protein [Phycisphaerae bacterium]|nr:ATP-binding cassette domain-containing protein [Phycisphaerae bacterium]
MAFSENGETHTSVRRFEDLSARERASLSHVAGDQAIRAVVDSDLLPSGDYGDAQLLLLDRELLALEDGREARRIALSELRAASCRHFVGNGVLDLIARDGRRIEAIRYSKSRAEAFDQLAEQINATLETSAEEIEARREDAAKASGPAEDRPTYRCPNCGYPLRHASDACPKCTSTRQVMWRLMKLMRHHWKLALFGLLMSLLFTAFNLAPPLLIQQLVDNALRPVSDARTGGGAVSERMLAERWRYLAGIVAALGGVFLARSISAHLRIRALGTLGNRVLKDLRSCLYRTLQRLSLSYYDREHTGRIMARMLTDTRVVQRFVDRSAQQILVNMLTVVGIAVVLFAKNWKLAAIALLPTPIVLLLTKWFSVRFRSIFRAVRRKYANLSASINETISGMRVVKSFAQEDREIDSFDEKNLEEYDARTTAVTARSRFIPSLTFLTSLGVLAVWLIGGGWVLGGVLTVGWLIAYISYMNMFYNPVRQLLNLAEVFQESATGAERIFNVMDTPSDVTDHEQACDVSAVRGQIDIRNVSFTYDEGEYVLKDITLAIAPGEMIGLVGQTGSGKSTLVSLVARFYDPTKGCICLDGVDLRDMRMKALRSNIGMVLQDPFLFAGTIRDNIAYGRPGASEAEIIQAAKAANAHEFIMNLPDAYDTRVGERGVSLSGGEKQRVSIARAVLKDPPILILDEATSAVDTATEAIIQEAMDRLVHGRTTIAIAHRLSTLRNADRLIVLDAGEIIEQGTHDELIAAGGLYADLCDIQANFAKTLPADSMLRLSGRRR